MVLFVSCWSCALAEKPANEYAAIDKKALAIPKEQTGSTDAIASYMKANFTTDGDKVRAIFIWTATTIEYDVEHMFAIDFHEKEEDKVTKALKTHKGICENYAAVFAEVCRKSGIRAYVVPGYTKQGGTASYLPHGWCAAIVDGEWLLFDPTWGSGYISNNRFVRKINNDLFKVKGAAMIKTHMPFDPMWELLPYPVTNQEFYEGKTNGDRSKAAFSYADSITAYEMLSELQQWASAVRRIEKNGVKNALVYDRLANIKQQIEINKQQETVNAHNKIVDVYNEAVADYNNGINELNAFINYRNAQFTPMKTDGEIQGMADSAERKITHAKELLNGLKDDDKSLSAMIASLNKGIDEAAKVMQEQQDFLKKYFAKGKLGRKTMFNKYTWMGIPLN